MDQQTPGRGLYDSRFEHDACGIGFVAQLSGMPSHDILAMAVTAVGNMAHRGGVGADGKSGDGAGVLTQIPRAFFARELAQRGISYPADDLAVGLVCAVGHVEAEDVGARGDHLLEGAPLPARRADGGDDLGLPSSVRRRGHRDMGHQATPAFRGSAKTSMNRE